MPRLDSVRCLRLAFLILLSLSVSLCVGCSGDDDDDSGDDDDDTGGADDDDIFADDDDSAGDDDDAGPDDDDAGPEGWTITVSVSIDSALSTPSWTPMLLVGLFVEGGLSELGIPESKPVALLEDIEYEPDWPVELTINAPAPGSFEVFVILDASGDEILCDTGDYIGHTVASTSKANPVDVVLNYALQEGDCGH